MEDRIFTIGHSNHSTDFFISLLKHSGINAIADVRSNPQTKANPDFCKNALKHVLASAGIKYVFLGKELGARSTNKECYLDGKVVYSRLAARPEFEEGLKRIEEGSEKYKIALMCAEREPLSCHRCILVARSLVDRGYGVKHILSNGEHESHEDTIDRLLGMLDLAKPDMFMSYSEKISLAYEKQEARIAYQQAEPETHPLALVG